MNQQNNIFFSAVYFALSAAITAWFIAAAPMYISQRQILLSGTIAGGKWAVQIIAALLLLKGRKWKFIRYIGFTCFIGSALLLPYAISGWFFNINAPLFFIGSLLVAVLAMVVLYFNSVITSRISLSWWTSWLVCLAVAITLQLAVVFDVV